MPVVINSCALGATCTARPEYRPVRAPASKKATLIAEVGHERPLAGKPTLESVVDTPCTRFQPAPLMSPAFIPGMLPPVLSTGACATGRIPRGCAWFRR